MTTTAVDTDAVDTDVTAPTEPARRLGCTCESPEPRAAGSALCAQCGLVFLTSEEYAEHLARSRAAVGEMLARLTSGEETTSGDPAEAGADEESGPSRRWWRRDRQPA